jgi:phage tail sheath protein FI
VTISPGDDYYLTASTASWTRFNVTYEEDLNEDATNRNWTVRESYENVVLSDTTDPNYITNVINDSETGSGNVEVLDYGNSQDLPALQGTAVVVEDFTSSQAHSDGSAGVDYDGAWKGWSYQVANDVFGTTFEASFNFIENGLQIGTGATPLSATVDVISPGTAAAPASVAEGSVSIHLVLTSASDVTLVDDPTTPGSGVGNIWDGVAGAAGTITYATGQITSAGAVADQLDIDAITAYAADTVVVDSAVLLEDHATSTLGLIYEEPVIIEDDGDGNLSVKANATGATSWPPPKFQLNSSGTNEIDYTDGSFTLTWKIDGYPAQGPAGDTTTYATHGVPASTADYYTNPEDSVQGVLTSGTDGTAVASTDIVDPSLVADQKGLYAFGQVDELMQLCAADFQTDVTVADAMITYAELMKDKFVLLTVPYGLKPLEATNWKKNTLNKFTSYAALYYPHIKIKDPVSNASLDIPCGGHVAGVYARTDTLANVSTAPAGMSRGALNWAIGLERDLTKDEVGVLRSDKINSNVQWANTGRVVWGGLTLDTTGGEWKYIQERRLFMFLEKSVYNATQLYVFENNTPALWGKIRLQVENFLSGLNAQGYFASTNPSDSYFVICDRSNNPQETVDQGIVFCDVGVAPTTPAEYIIFRFAQKAL